MRKSELVEELERLGSLPVPLPDLRRINTWQRRLHRGLTLVPDDPHSSPSLAPARQHRRLLLAGVMVAAAGTVLLLVIHRDSRPRTELEAASGAVVVLPGGETVPLHPGDEIPSGGVIHTGSTGSVTIGGTKVGPGQAVLVDDGRVTLLPEVPPTIAATSAAPTAEPARAPTRPQALSVTPQPTAKTSAPATHTPSSSPPRPTAVPAPVTAPTPVPAPAPPTQPAPPPAPQPPATQITARSSVLGLTVAREGGGVRLSWTATDSPAFGRYVVVRGSISPARLNVIAQITDQQITSFTDPAPPHGVDLFYRVIALGQDNRLLGMSNVVAVKLDDSPAPTTIASSTSMASSSAPDSTPVSGDQPSCPSSRSGDRKVVSPRICAGS